MTNTKNSIISSLLGHAIALIIGLVVSVILIAVFSAIMANTSIPDPASDLLVIVSASLGALLCGFLLAKFRSGKGIISGLLGGVMFFASIFSVGAICFHGSGFGSLTLSMLIFTVLSSTVGGILSANLLRH